MASDVVINQSPAVQVTLTGSASINSLTLSNDTLTVSGGTLSLAANSSIGSAGNLNLSASAILSLASAATLTNSGSITVSPGSEMTGGNYAGNATANLNLSAGSAGTGVGTNLLNNPGFESPAADGSTTTQPDEWGQWGDSYVSTDYSRDGSQSLMEFGSNSGVYESFSVNPGVSYVASVYALNPSSNPLTGGQEAFLHYEFDNASGQSIDAPNESAIVDADSPTDVWTDKVLPFNAPSGAASITLYLQVGPYFGDSGTGDGTAYFDDAAFGPVATVDDSASVATITNSGTITIGAGATITDAGSFTQTTTGNLISQLGAPPSGDDFGSLNVAGTAALAGTLEATLVNGYSPSINDGFTLISYANETDGLTSEQLPAGSGYTFQPALNPTYFGISAVPPTLTTTINTATNVATATDNLVGVNLAYWDDLLTTTQTRQMVESAGLSLFRFPGGGSSDDFHFNVADNYGDPAANTIPQFAQFISEVGGTGIVTVDYGSGSPQEAEAELAYLEGSTSDTTSIGTGPEWSDSAKAWQNVNWQTVQYWADLRAAKPLNTNDGLNFLRINQPAPFADVNDWEIGNELYGTWETDHHTVPNDPATYAAFAASFAQFVVNDPLLPRISMGIDSGDPTTGYNDWTRNVLTDLYEDGYVPGFISDHSYMQSAGSENDSFLLNDTVSDPSSILDWSTRYADYESMLDSIVGASNAAGVKIMATEFNSNPGVEGKQMTSLVNGLFIADSIGSLLDSGYAGGLVWDLRNGFTTDGNNSPSLYGWREGGDEGIIGTDNQNTPPVTGPYVPYPSYFGEQISSYIMQSGGAAVSVVSNYNELTVYSVLEPNGHLDLMVLNKNPDASLTDQFDLPGFAPSGQGQYWQYGEAQDYAQSQSANGGAALASSTFSLSLTGNHFSFTFPAYSMTVLDLAPFAAVAGSTLTVDLSNTSPASIATTGGTIVATEGGDSLAFSGVTAVNVIGTPSSDVLNFNGSIAAPVNFTSSGTTTLNLSNGSLTLAAGTGSTVQVVPFYQVNILPGASMSLSAPVSESTRTLLDTQYLSIAGSIGHWTGKLDLNANDLEVVVGNIAAINDQVRQGYFGGDGIFSSAAMGSMNHLTTPGTILNTVDGTSSGAALFNSGKPFDLTSPPASAVLVKFTYYGDVNLDGKVDGSDYARLDSNHLSQLTGWFNGDLNYDGVVNGSDYTLMDNAFNMQGAALTTEAEPADAVANAAPASRRTSFDPGVFSTQQPIVFDDPVPRRIKGLVRLGDVLDVLDAHP